MAEFRVNQQITSRRVNLVLSDGKMHGEVDIWKAREIAQKHSLDLVEVSPGNVPICRLMNYGKIKFSKSKQKKQKHASQILKEIRVSYATERHDLEIKHKKAKQILNKHSRVKYTLELRGRQRVYLDDALAKFKTNLEDFSNFAVWDEPQVSGRMITTILTSCSN